MDSADDVLGCVARDSPIEIVDKSASPFGDDDLPLALRFFEFDKGGFERFGRLLLGTVYRRQYANGRRTVVFPGIAYNTVATYEDEGSEPVAKDDCEDSAQLKAAIARHYESFAQDLTS